MCCVNSILPWAANQKILPGPNRGNVIQLEFFFFRTKQTVVLLTFYCDFMLCRNICTSGATEDISGSCPPPNHCLWPPNEKYAPPSEDCAPMKATGSVPLECISGPETPKILVINSVFVGKSRFFADL